MDDCVKEQVDDLDNYFNTEILNYDDDHDYKLTDEEIALLLKHGKAINKKLYD